MQISDDDADMIAGRVFDAIERTGTFNRQLVATEIRAGLALVNGPLTYRTLSVRGAADRLENFYEHPAFVKGYNEVAKRLGGDALPSSSDIERQVVKAMEELLGMPLSVGKRDPDGTAHYRLPETRKQKQRYQIPASSKVWRDT